MTESEQQTVTLIGERNSWHAGRIRSFLDRNIYPYRWVDSDSSEGAALLEVVSEDVRSRLLGMGFDPDQATVLADHFLEAERRGKRGHGLSRVEWLGTQRVDPAARPERVLSVDGYERWDGRGAVGYLTLAAICDAQISSPPEHALVVAASHCFPTGMLGYWTRRLADAGLVAALTATSPARLGHPDGGPPLAGTNDALAGEGFGAVLLVARPEADPVPALRRLADGIRLPGDAPTKA